MEKDFYTDDFEQLLKDTTEDFRMYPSRKVWHSLYNDLHPAKKWPSFAVCLLLITAILYIGIDNNNAINADADNIVLSTLSTGDNNSAKKVSSASDIKKSSSGSQAEATRDLSTNTTSLSFAPDPLNSELIINHSINFPTLAYKEQKVVMIPMPAVMPIPHSDVSARLRSEALQNVNMSDPGTGESIVANGNEQSEVSKSTAVSTTNNQITGQTIPPPTTTDVTSLDEASSIATPLAVTPQSTSAKTNAADKAWIENYAFHNAKNGNKFKTKLSTLVYITPSIGYRVLNKNNNFEPVNALLIRSSANSVDADDAITQQAAMNLESGATAILDLSRRLRVKAGIQFNYTNYVSDAQRLSHPSQTNILLNDLSTGNTMLVPVSTTYGNKGADNSMRLNNNTVQFAIPIGADYKVAGNDRIKWYVGATIQPTYVAGGNAYLVSSDYKNYVDMPSMLRTWNLNAGFESFVSYKTKGGSVINLGPQFRYQLLSTYSSRYTYTENLYNVGIKVGITRKF